MRTCSKAPCDKKHFGKNLCRYHYNKQYCTVNRSKILINKQEYYISNRDKIRAVQKIYQDNNFEAVRIQHKRYRNNNRDEVRRAREKWKARNIVKMREYNRNKYKNDVQYRLGILLRSRLRNVLRRCYLNSKCSAVQNLGCTIPEFKAYLESKFAAGMTWDNQGKWHIDHIKPLVSFDLTNAVEQKMACHYTNLQPLWAADNLRKGTQDDLRFREAISPEMYMGIAANISK